MQSRVNRTPSLSNSANCSDILSSCKVSPPNMAPIKQPSFFSVLWILKIKVKHWLLRVVTPDEQTATCCAFANFCFAPVPKHHNKDSSPGNTDLFEASGKIIHPVQAEKINAHIFQGLKAALKFLCSTENTRCMTGHLDSHLRLLTTRSKVFSLKAIFSSSKWRLIVGTSGDFAACSWKQSLRVAALHGKFSLQSEYTTTQRYRWEIREASHKHIFSHVTLVKQSHHVLQDMFGNVTSSTAQI